MIRDHQHLLEKFYEADRAAISEWSSEIEDDTNRLNEEVEEYAKRNNLDSSFIIEIEEY